MIIVTSDGISHGQPESLWGGSAFRLDTACGLKFGSWTYAGMKYGDGDPDSDGERPVVTPGFEVNCMTCRVRRAS